MKKIPRRLLRKKYIPPLAEPLISQIDVQTQGCENGSSASTCHMGGDVSAFCSPGAIYE